MAKADPSGFYKPIPFEGQDNPKLVQWITQEFYRISAVFDVATARNVEFLNVAPAKPREGMVTGADGVNWNPGAGKGVYAYYTGAWHFLG